MSNEKLDGVGRVNLSLLGKSYNIREDEGLYRVTGTDASGQPIDESLTADDLNRYSDNLKALVDKAAESCRGTGSRHKDEHDILKLDE